METLSTPSFRKGVSISAVVGFIIFLLYLVLCTEIGSVADVIGTTNILLYSLAFLSILAGVTFNALAWQQLLKNLSIGTTFRRIFNLSWVGIFLDSLIPGGWSGDAFKAYLLAKDPDIDGGRTAASIVIKNVLELLITLSISILGLTLLALNYTLESGVLIAIGSTMLLLTLPLIIILYLSIDHKATKRIIRFFVRPTSSIRRKRFRIDDFETKIEKALANYRDGITTLKSKPKTLIRPVSFQVMAWVFDILALFLIFASIGHFVSADKVIITNTISVNLQTQGVALAGFAQLVSANVYTILNILPTVSAAATVLAGFASFWLKIVISFLAFQCVVLGRCIPFICNSCGFGGGSCKCELPNEKDTDKNGDSKSQHKKK